MDVSEKNTYKNPCFSIIVISLITQLTKRNREQNVRKLIKCF